MTVQKIRARLEHRIPGIMDAQKHFAVLVPLVEQDGQLHVLYELRSATLRRQPREVCFPGGRVEQGETPEQCALRETWEELAIPADAIELIAPLDLLCHRSGFVLHPFLARIDADAAARLICSSAEVDEVFFVPLEQLRTLEAVEYRYDLIPSPGADFPYERIGIPRDYPWQKGEESGPIYRWQGRGIWGITGRITRHLLELTTP